MPGKERVTDHTCPGKKQVWISRNVYGGSSLLELGTLSIAGEAKREVPNLFSGVVEAPGDFSLPGIPPWSFPNASPIYQKIVLAQVPIQWVP